MATTFAQKFRNVSRLSQIVNILGRYGFSKELRDTELASYVTETPPQSEALNQQNNPEKGTTELSGARRLALAFEELGPTFVKLGQLLASREDVLPRDVIIQLRRLQDRAKPVPMDVVQKILDKEYRGKTEEYSNRSSLSPSAPPVSGRCTKPDSAMDAMSS
jgi:ubiquinone biosynthesis protein